MPETNKFTTIVAYALHYLANHITKNNAADLIGLPKDKSPSLINMEHVKGYLHAMGDVMSGDGKGVFRVAMPVRVKGEWFVILGDNDGFELGSDQADLTEDKLFAESLLRVGKTQEGQVLITVYDDDVVVQRGVKQNGKDNEAPTQAEGV